MLVQFIPVIQSQAKKLCSVLKSEVREVETEYRIYMLIVPFKQINRIVFRHMNSRLNWRPLEQFLGSVFNLLAYTLNVMNDNTDFSREDLNVDVGVTRNKINGTLKRALPSSPSTTTT